MNAPGGGQGAPDGGAAARHEAWARSARAIVVGCGGIGGCAAAALVDAGRSVVVVTGNPAIARVVNEQGLAARLPAGERTARLRAVASAAELPPGPYHLALFAVPPNRLDEAAADVSPWLGDAGLFVPMTNGLPEERLAARYGAGRVVGCIVGYGASMRAPGQVEQTSEGSLTLGRPDGSVDDGVGRTARFVEPIAPAVVTSNLRGARWSKLAINCAISALGTLGGDRLGALLRHRFIRRLCLEVMTEVTTVALRRGVSLEKIAGTVDLAWLALDENERARAGSPGLVARHTVLLAVGMRYRRLRSSMLAAIERGREPPIEQLNGEVVARARDAGLPVPVNEAVVAAVKALARREGTPSLETLRALYDRTRAGPVRARPAA